MADDGYSVERQMLAEAERFAVAAQIDPPAHARSGQGQEQAGEPQARLVYIGGNQDRGVVATAKQVREGAQRAAAKMITIEPIEAFAREVTLNGIGHGRARGLTKGDDQNAW